MRSDCFYPNSIQIDNSDKSKMYVKENSVKLFVASNQVIQRLHPTELEAALQVVQATAETVVPNLATAGLRSVVIMLPNADNVPSVQNVPNFEKLANQIVRQMGLEFSAFWEGAQRQLRAELEANQQIQLFDEEWKALKNNHETPVTVISDLNNLVKKLVYQTPNWIAAILAFRNAIREYISDDQIEAGEFRSVHLTNNLPKPPG